jgi:DNA modification methylase
MNAPAENLGEGGGRGEVQANHIIHPALSTIGAPPPPPVTVAAPDQELSNHNIYFGDCREIMRRWQEKIVQMCVTSPPYFGLRDYGHEGQIGIEETPEEYVTALVEVFREVRRVMRDDGTLWLNVGDSYAAQRGGSHMPAQTVAGGVGGKGDKRAFRGMGGVGRGAAHRNASAIGLKHKDLIGIPWRLAFALQADGWYLRQDIIWHKPNPMPESMTDRCTKAHEYIFLLAKSERYYFDAAAIQEKAVGDAEFRKRRSVWSVPTKPYKGAHFATFPPMLIEPCILAGSRVGDIVLDPFMGSGTTAMVARQHLRGWLGCELNESYGPLQQARLGPTPLVVAS